MTWTADQLDRLGRTAELHINTFRADGSPRRALPIWVVRVGDDLYVRSAFGTQGGWYRHATADDGRAHISAGPVDADVRLTAVADPATEDAVATAYRTKYRGQGSALDTMVSDTAAATTLRLDPVG
ncbi:DUF2255 family protein [Nocardia sp. NPDC050718]|uniref:DUF2255 family protein n=1 Tax=unclassified Nocardia TaxID=2637762 RepID=UPI0033C76B3C